MKSLRSGKEQHNTVEGGDDLTAVDVAGIRQLECQPSKSLRGKRTVTFPNF